MMTSASRIGPERATNRRRAAINYAIFAAIAVTIGWAGVALDAATDQPATNSLGMGLWIIAPALAGILLVRFRPDGAGPLGLTLRFGKRTRWFGFATLLYPAVTALIVLAAIASGVGTFDASGRSGSPALIVAMAAVLPALPSRTRSRSSPGAASAPARLSRPVSPVSDRTPLSG